MTIESTAQLTIGSATHDVAAVEVRCAGSWTVHRIAGLERELDALPIHFFFMDQVIQQVAITAT